MKKNNKKRIAFILTKLIPFLLFLFSIWLLVLGVRSYLNNAVLFKIKNVKFIGIDDQKTAQKISSMFLGENIFSLNLDEINDYLKRGNPQFYDVKAIKDLPDQLVFHVALRKPAAQIKEKGFYLADNDGVIISGISKTPFDNFIVLSNLSGASNLSFGKKINLAQLKSGLALVKSLDKIKEELISLIAGLKLNTIEIDLSKYPSLYVYFGGWELRLDSSSDLDKQLELIKKILISLDKKIGQLQYIDLRFTEPTISFKEK